VKGDSGSFCVFWEGGWDLVVLIPVPANFDVALGKMRIDALRICAYMRCV
jgi:hypothetical protein